MWGVFAEYYTDVKRDRFEADLEPKSHVILLIDGDDMSIQGFSTLETYDRVIDNRRVLVVFSGDTIVARPHWGQTVLQRAFLQFVMKQKITHPMAPVYWFLISKGYKTYLLLTRNFPEHWPRFDRPTPPWQAAVIRELGMEKFGDEFEPEHGLIRHEDALGRLKEGVAPVDDALLAHPDIGFFVHNNPGYMDGDEMCCLGRVDIHLWVSYMYKLLKRALVNKRGSQRIA